MSATIASALPATVCQSGQHDAPLPDWCLPALPTQPRLYLLREVLAGIVRDASRLQTLGPLIAAAHHAVYTGHWRYLDQSGLAVVQIRCAY